MSSLYQIEAELIELFNEIEANEGEITDEQYNKLLITQENFKEKLKSFHKVIQVYTGEMSACKEEEKRIAAYRKVRENRINRLKQSVLDAVIMFGNDGKSGNKVIELDTFKAFTKGSQSTELDEPRINMLLISIREYINAMINEGALKYGDVLDAPGILASVNEMLKAELGESFVEYTMDDLHTINVSASVNGTLADIIEKRTNLFIAGFNGPHSLILKNETPKEEFKNAIKDGKDITLAELVTNQSIQFK